LVQSQDENNVKIEADQIEVSNDGNKINATGNIKVKTEELNSIANELIYLKDIEEIKANGNVIIKDKLDNFYFFNEFISDKNFNDAKGSNVKIRLKDGARIVGKTFSRIDSNINQINDASYTPCLREGYIISNCPGWKLSANKVIHDTENKNVYYEGATLSVLNVPILYTPFFSHPDPSVKKRTGLLMPSFSSDNRLGETLSIPFFYNISSNYDLTFTPTIQTKVDDYYSLDYRHLTKNHKFNINSSISDNESNTGTKNHIFIYGAVKNPFGEFDYKLETSNNDTYLRKNYINDSTTLSSGFNFSKEMDNSHFELSSYIYKHLNNNSNQEWEYVYPDIKYDIANYTDPIFGLKWSINNSFLNYKNIDKQSSQQISSEIQSSKVIISGNTGLKFENTALNRLLYFNNSSDNFNQLRIFPQLSSKISFPLSKSKGSRTEIIEPIIMPILAPYNNYNNSQSVSNSNIFSLNRETSQSQWESGPRINYGVNWLLNDNNLIINTSIGQSIKFNKHDSPNSNTISNYFISNTVDFGNIGYINANITIDRSDLYLKDNNINSSINIGKVKFGFDYDYETTDRVKTSEQISIGTKINLAKHTNIIASTRKDLLSEKSIGNAFGIYYENDCLAINLDYYRDLTAVHDIKFKEGFSFTITLKPFGTSKNYGKVRNYGPDL
jgi:LPS-assembly protein